jgi:hypothetical protein
MKTSLLQINKGLQGISEKHLQVADYFWGDWGDFFNGGKNRKYLAIIANVTAPITFSSITEINLNLICVDQVKDDNFNLDEVESDTLQVLHDYFRIIKHSQNWKEIGAIRNTNSPLKFKDKGDDEVAGWQMTINYKLIESIGLCDLPVQDYDFTKKIKC